MFLLRIKDRAECCKGTGLHGGDTAQKKPILGVGWGGHRTYFLDWVNNWDVEGGGHRTYFVEEGNNWGGDTAQH